MLNRTEKFIAISNDKYYNIGDLKLPRTNRADKAFRMPVSTESRDVAIHYRLTTPSTSGSEHGIVIFTAKRLAISFMKASLTKWLTTTCTDKMFWMPCLVQSCYTRL